MKPNTENKQINANRVFERALQVITDYLNRLDRCLHAKELSQLIETGFLEVSNSLISIGDEEYHKIPNHKDFDFKQNYIFNYLLPESIKDTMLIHRDVFLQLQISNNKKQESLVNEEAIQNHFVECKTLLQEATNALVEKIRSEQNTFLKNTKKRRKRILLSKHQQNPWEVYKKQFLSIQEQIQEIKRSADHFSEIVLVFEEIKTHTQSICNNLSHELENSKESINQILDSLEKAQEVSEINNTITQVDSALTQIDLQNPSQENYALDMESKISILKEYSIPVGSEEGLLLIKKIDFAKSTKRWLNYMLLPDLIELWQNRMNIIAFYKHNLLNLKSSLSLLKTNKHPEALSSQIQSLQILLKSIHSNENLQRELIAQVQKNLNNNFRVTKIYGTDDFLKISLQSSLSQFTSSKNNILKDIQKKVKSILSFFSTTYKTSKINDPFKKLEAASRCIDHRTFKTSDIHYDSLFLNKNFIGDLFLVTRENEKQKIQENLNMWKKGHSKAVLVVGNHLSGKSSFIESIAKDFFNKNKIILNPNSKFSIEGRKFKTTKNLTEALQHIKKNTYNSQALLVIDNLELWRDKENSLLENTRAIIQFIESESDQVFVILSTSNDMQAHLDKRLPFTHSFSSIIDVNKSSFEEIHKAILLRHGASHQNLVTEKGLPLPNNQLELYIQKLCRKYEYNLGEVLQAWTYSIQAADANNIVYQEQEYDFEDFFTSEEAIILKFVLLYQHINEFILKNFLGQRYDSAYKSGLKRLTNTKVFLRNSEGNLSVNPLLYHDIRSILKYRGVLN
jgi:hypothetical protein